MADTKKEHYVPRFYLKNFTNDDTNKINVFDKKKEEQRLQKIMNVAMENYFYDLDLEKELANLNEDNAKTIKNKLIKALGINNWEEVTQYLKKYVEKDYLSSMESHYSHLFNSIIKKSYSGNSWVLAYCNSMSKEEKSDLSFFIALQLIRTKDFRELFKDTKEKFFKAAIKKDLFNNQKDNYDLDNLFNKEDIKLEHLQMVINIEYLAKFANEFENYNWVMYVNKTTLPFYTSDNPVALLGGHNKDHLNRVFNKIKDVKILFPITPMLTLAMYEKDISKNHIVDRQFFELNSIWDVAYVDKINASQVFLSYRFIYSIEDNFSQARKICEDNPSLKQQTSKINVC